jgi:LmbE family N-acetylglucosaminyl deacetylase
MADRTPTLMAVHAHPDDEALFTGGVLAHYAELGVQTVVVTCTDGALGDLAGEAGRRPGAAGDGAAVGAQRWAELEASCAALGVAHLEGLGFHDSGMMGWAENDAPDAFWNVPVARAADRLAGLIARYRPQVVVTYDADGFYGHPDHIQAHRVTVAAVEGVGTVDKLYFVAIPRSALAGFADLARDAGMALPGWVEGEPAFGTDDELVATFVDCSGVVDAKYRALAAHASQVDNAFFLDMGPELFGQIFSVESFVRSHDRSGAPLPEDDLFAGLPGVGPP